MEFPEHGYYYHYKHNPAGSFDNYAYEVVGIARNTEDKSLGVLYRPLYESEWMPPADAQCRPLEMFMESVEKDGMRVPRFARITDPALIERFDQIRKERHGT